MTKTKAIAWAVFFGVLVVVCLPSQAYACAFPFLIAGLVFTLIAWSKHRRDTQIVAEAYQEERASHREAYAPPMTSKGSNGRLFVPPPLQ